MPTAPPTSLLLDPPSWRGSISSTSWSAARLLAGKMKGELDLVSRKLLAGKMKGERRSKRRGQSVEFADYRNYTIGDDLRFIDWNIYARLDKLFLKLFIEEEDLSLYVLVDVSASCNFGEPNKMTCISSVSPPRSGTSAWSITTESRSPRWPMGIVAETGAMRGRRRVSQMIDFVSKLEPAGTSHFAESCKRFALSNRHKGVCVVLSDFFFVKEGFESGLRYVAGGKYDLFCVQVLSPQEIEPDLSGDLKLRDVEDSDMAEVSITQPLIKQYKANLNAYCLSLKEYITRRGGTYLFSSTAVPFETLVLNYLRERGLLG